MSQQPDISIIIVNYNVKEFLANCLHSVKKASRNLETEVIVVDNASDDESMAYLKPRFKDVTFIENDENVGFGKANNQALKQVTGKYTLLLNPDTLLQEDTLSVLKDHMDKNDQTGACGCKIVNPDGSFAPESRRTIPTLSTAVYKALGLTALFPKSKLFGAYYLGWKDENEAGEVPVLSGSFMFFRTKALKEAGGFDERFFMYAEDIDLCYRIRENNWKIDYVPATSIIHYKGESSKLNNMSYIWHFNNSLYLFFDKHYSFRYSALFRVIVYAAILIRTFFSFISVHFLKYRYVIYDIILLNIALFIGYASRFSFDKREIIERMGPEFLWLNLILSISYLVFGNVFGIVNRHKFSIAGSLKAVFLSFVTLVAITFFVRDLAFSRIILGLSGIFGFLLVALLRILRLNFSKNLVSVRGRFKTTGILIVGVNEKTADLIKKISGNAGWQIKILGIIHQEKWDGKTEIEGVTLIGSIQQLPELIRATKADQVYYLTDALSFGEIMSSLEKIKHLEAESKIVSSDVNFLLGKANVEYLDDIAVMEADMSFLNPVQRFLKRAFDIVLSLAGVLLLTPFVIFGWIINRNKSRPVPCYDGRKMTSMTILKPVKGHKWVNRWLCLLQVLSGKISFTGSDINGSVSNGQSYKFKSGLTGYWQLHKNGNQRADNRQRFDLYYLQNYSVWFDVDILIKSLLKGSILDQF
ncbi:MAG: glycosyltransferase [Balneolaceae bacterium]